MCARRRTPRVFRCLAALLASVPAACIADSVIDEHARVAAVEDVAPVSWLPADPAALPGGWESDGIEGEAAALVWKIYYHFAEDGTYTGAALVLADPDPEFQTLSGTWSVESGALTLNSDAPVPAWIAGERLKLEGPAGTVTFHRVRFQ
jgi:hypothetical protein